MSSSVNQSFDCLFKVLLLGDMSVGKSSILLRYSDNLFSASTSTTIGVDFKIRSVKLNGKTIKLQIWDTAGQERFRTITSSYYKGSHGALLVFSLAKRITFEHLDDWYKDLRNSSDSDLNIILIGNKKDLVDQRVVSYEEASEWAKKRDIKYLETSAKDSTNVGEAFQLMVSQLYNNKFENSMVDTNPNIINISSDFRAKPKKKRKICSMI